MASAGDEPLRFRGAPQLVGGFVPIPHTELLTVEREVAIERIPADELVGVQSVPHGRQSEIRFVLPETTPPGEYPGTLRLGDHRFAIVVQVDPVVHLAAVPGRFDLVSNGGDARETLTILNAGNTATTIDRRYALGLFAHAGLDRMLGKTLGADAPDGHARVDTLMSAAADEYGGLVVANVAAGAGPLEPGQARAVTFAFTFPQKSRASASYFGYLSVANLTIPVSVRTEYKPTEVPA
jgi:hypothetical protein